MLPADLPADMPSFLRRFGTDDACRAHLFSQRWPAGFRCDGCGHERCYAHKKRIIHECAGCGKQHSLLAGTIFEQTKTGLAKWFLAIFLVTSSKGGIAAAELKRQLGFGSDQTAWVWLHKIRRAMVDPGRQPLAGTVEADETLIGAPRSGKRGRGAAGKTIVAGAVETRGAVVTPAEPERPLSGIAKRKREAMKPRFRRWLGRTRLAKLPDQRAASLEAFLTGAVTPPAAVATDGNQAYAGLESKGFVHEPVNLAKTWGDALLHLPAVHLVFGHVKRWLLGTHHGGVSAKHLQVYLDEYVFRFNRRAAKSISHRFQRVIEIALMTPATTYRGIVGRKRSA